MARLGAAAAQLARLITGCILRHPAVSEGMNALATFGNLFGPDMLIVGLFVLLFFGAKKLPELARGLGQSLNEFKKAREEFEHELTSPSTSVNVQEARDKFPRNSGGPSAQELQQQVEELQRQLHASQVRQQTPQLVSSTPISAEVVEEPVRQANP